VAATKALGVEDIASHKKGGLEISEMVRSAWIFRRLVDSILCRRDGEDSIGMPEKQPGASRLDTATIWTGTND